MGEPRAFMLGGGMITVAGIIGGVIIALGFTVRLFGMVEARLIENEQGHARDDSTTKQTRSRAFADTAAFNCIDQRFPCRPRPRADDTGPP